MSILTTAVAGATLILVLVTVHEAGHFLFARLFGIGAPIFSVGVGPRLFGVQFRGTDFRISALPLGGYVMLAGVDPFGDEDPDAAWGEVDEQFLNHPVWQRLIVMAAGPLFNILLPLVVFAALLMNGMDEPDNVVGGIVPGTPAAEAGLQTDDRLVAVDGQPVDAWSVLVRHLDGAENRPVELTYERDGQTRTALFPAGWVQYTFDGLVDTSRMGLMHSRMSARVGVDDPDSPAGQAGLQTGDLVHKVDGVDVRNWDELHAALAEPGSHTLVVERIVGDSETEEQTVALDTSVAWQPKWDDPAVDAYGLVPVQLYVSRLSVGFPAEAAGVLPDDRLLAIDDRVARSWEEVVWLVAATVEQSGWDAKPRSIQVTVVRDGALKTLEFTPRVERQVVRGEPNYRPLMGVYAYSHGRVPGATLLKAYGVGEALPVATEQVLDLIRRTLSAIGYLFTGDLKPQETVGGPVAMLQFAGEAAEQGVSEWIQLLALFSLSLGVVNLLPVPVLDGGHILFYTLEAVRGRPVSREIRERTQMIGVLVLAVVMLLVIVMDIDRWVRSGDG